MEDDFVTFDSPPLSIVNSMRFDRLGLTQNRICNVVAVASQVLIYLPFLPKKNVQTISPVLIFLHFVLAFSCSCLKSFLAIDYQIAFNNFKYFNICLREN